MTASAKYSSRSTLSVQGDALSNAIDVSRSAGGALLVNGGAIPVASGPATVSNTRLIQIVGADGDDSLTLDESLGALPKASLIGGNGNDVMTAGSGDDLLLGDAGDDTLFGLGGVDLMHGGDGNDVLSGGAGNDFVNGNAGDDRLIWNPGDGSDVFEGGAGSDTAEINGDNGAEVFTLTANADRVRLDRVTPSPFSIDAGTIERFVVKLGGGDDSLSASGNVPAGFSMVIDGGAGNDSIGGSSGDDRVLGGDGDDVALMGAGDDTFVWNPGDDNDVLEGQAGSDTMLFNGANLAESITVSADGDRVVFLRNIANVVMDLDDTETIRFNALGGDDTVTVNDLSGTDVTTIDINLAGSAGGGDGAVDTVIVNATNGDDVVAVSGNAGGVAVDGLAATINLVGFEAGVDRSVIKLLAGDDRLIWNSGEVSGVVEGGTGIDTMLFFGVNASETVSIVANSERVMLQRDVATTTMDLNDTERLEFRALDGADSITIGNLGGTDATQIDIDLRGSSGGGDGATDTITVDASNVDDVFGVAGDGGGITVFGLQAAVTAFFFDGTDRLTLNAQGGNDVVDASGLQADGIRLTMNGGLGNDVFFGGAGSDLITGGDGDDVALMGAGDDTFVWNPGDDDDVLEGQAGSDTMLFNGANLAEIISVSANGGRVVFLRNIANVVMDLDDTETIRFNALGGADTITVNDLGGTDVTTIDINLAGSAGGGDGAVDTVIVNTTQGDDVVVVFGDAAGVSIVGLAATINLVGFEPNVDRIVINLLAGDDTLEASGLTVTSTLLTGNGDSGDDILVGGDGNDTLNGGPGDDVLIGGPGADVLDGGPGGNVVIQIVGTQTDPDAMF